ncbi:IS66 family insertion sequence element accessory protein TnpB [Agrobacterium vitis]|uniref:IS66 family insertion sequence element accessory protein TnpB n=1 Tax=Agrobacterium vitis TaxID=373 RepID=UPI002AC9D575|nr:IS66 family insertion sequence element accessory protein TnpB [Agrobacterium vitis]MCM2450243.1 transposase [Agrobacterium vitis]MCM2471254.1 transposase [Agrobacterium vitis]
MGIKDETDALPALTAYLRWQWLHSVVRYKVLEKGRFPWPSANDGTARLTAAQLSMLWEGIDWRRPAWTSAPTRVA